MRITAFMTTVAGIAAILACDSLVSAASIPITNPGFEDVTGITPNNSASFNNENAHNLASGGSGAGTYNGWSESQANFSSPGVNVGSLGLINVGQGDFTVESPAGDAILGNANGDEDEDPDVNFPKMVIYQESDGRVNQTTSYAITGLETSFTMTVDVGQDQNGAYRGYNFSIYRDNAGTKTILGTLDSVADGGDPAGDSWANKSLTISGDFSAFVGQLVGVSLYHGTLGDEDSIVWYDNVTLDVEAVPEPSTFVLCSFGTLGLVGCCLRQRRRLNGC